MPRVTISTLQPTSVSFYKGVMTTLQLIAKASIIAPSTAWYLVDLGEARGVLFRDQRSLQLPAERTLMSAFSATDYWVQECFKLPPLFC